MMKKLSHISGYAAVLGGVILFGSLARDRVVADPTDDFSFTLVRAQSSDRHTFMSEKRVATILGDRMKGISPHSIPHLAKHIVRLCHQHRFDPAIVLALIHVESSFQTHVVSHAGAIGLMQVMPATGVAVAKEFGLYYRDPSSLKNPFINLSIGMAYLATLRNRYRYESPYFYLAAYNLGPTRLDQLRSIRGSEFRPNQTKEYYEKIRKWIPAFRYYRMDSI